MVIRMTNEKAIKILDNMPIPSHYFILDKEPITFEEMAEAIEMSIEALKNERPHGKWMTTWDRYVFQCSCCHGKCVKYNFCPECGADMREEEGGRQ